MFISRPTAITPIAYDLQYMPSNSPQSLRTYSDNGFRQRDIAYTPYSSRSYWNSVCCLIGFITAILIGVALAIALVFILKSNNNGDPINNTSTSSSTDTTSSATTTIIDTTT